MRVLRVILTIRRFKHIFKDHSFDEKIVVFIGDLQAEFFKWKLVKIAAYGAREAGSRIERAFQSVAVGYLLNALFSLNYLNGEAGFELYSEVSSLSFLYVRFRRNLLLSDYSKFS